MGDSCWQRALDLNVCCARYKARCGSRPAKEELASLHSQIVADLEWAWEMTGGSKDQLMGTMMQISGVVARQFNKQE